MSDKRFIISHPIAKELELFNKYYRESVFSENPRIQEVIDYVMKSDGKKLRPVLLLLAAKACGEINEMTYQSAVTVELLHTASLIHDDVVDESMVRRGKPSANAVYDNKIAVLAGDYFLSTALIKSILTGNLEIISSISNLGRNLAEGELNQLVLVKKMIIDEEEYLGVIKKKTASLLSICMRIGAISVSASAEEVERFAKIGEYLGICFQLRDDIFDYYSNDVGKPTGNDIREGKVTLPLLHVLKKTSADISKPYMDIILHADFSEDNIQRLISFAIANGGIEYTYDKMEEYRSQALELINELPESDVKSSLSTAVEYIIERTF